MEVNILKKGGLTFSEINIGEVFEFEYDFYMKIDRRAGTKYNAVDMSTGYIYIFEDFEEVIKVKATLNIDR